MGADAWLEKWSKKMDFTKAELRQWIGRFQVQDPVRFWLEPVIELAPIEFKSCDGRPQIEISCSTFCCSGSRKRIPLKTIIDVPFLVGGEYAFHAWLRGLLIKVLQHELDEAIYVAGRKIFDPHPLELKGES